MPELYKLTDFCKLLNISKAQALRLIHGCKIKAFKCGADWRISEDAIQKFIEENSNIKEAK
jgi:excisionase family DNA binding protein